MVTDVMPRVTGVQLAFGATSKVCTVTINLVKMMTVTLAPEDTAYVINVIGAVR